MAKKKTAAKSGKSAKKKSPGLRYWLFKSEPSAYSIQDLSFEANQTTFWDGVRNYQARNFLRDDVQVGDRVFFYHSNAKPMAIVGTMEVVKAGYPDHTQFDKDDKHYDANSDPESPTWHMVDVKLLQEFPEPVDRDMLREDETTKGMMVMQRGSRLSIQPVAASEWKAVHRLAGVKDVK